MINKINTFSSHSGLTSEGSLIDFSVFGSWKRHSVWFQLQNSFRSLSAHVMDGVLISQPIASLYCIVCVPSPVIIVHISKGSVDTSLSGNSVRSGGEKFRDTGSFETLFDETKGSSKTGSSSTNDDGVESVINDGIFFEECILKIGLKLPQNLWQRECWRR